MGSCASKWTALILAAALLISLVPGHVRAEEPSDYVILTEPSQLVSGRYVLLSSQGYAPGCLENDWLLPVIPSPETGWEGAVWTLEVSEAGVLLTDPAGVRIAPGEDEESGLIPGEYFWQVTFAEGKFSFHATVGETAVTLARCDDQGFRIYDDRMIGALYDGGFTLYHPEEHPEEPETPTDPPEDPTDPSVDPEEPTDPPEDPTDPPEEPVVPAGPGLFFGQLHSHTSFSGGAGTPAEAFAYARDTAGLDFLAITDHSNSLDGADFCALTEDASLISQQWKQGREAAKEISNGAFLGLYGFEMTWQNGLGHISTFFTPGFQTRNQPLYGGADGLTRYYETLAAVPGSVSQFNHPGSANGDFENFSHYSPQADNSMQLLEVVCEGSRHYDAYTRALDLGWHVAPTNNQNNHSADWGTRDSGRTVVYAQALTEAAFADALRNRRVYATEDSDLEIFWSLEGALFGSILRGSTVGDRVVLTGTLRDPSDGAVGKVEVITDGGISVSTVEISGSESELQLELPSDCSYYYLRITQSDGDMAVTAPVWIEHAVPMEITAFAADTHLAVRNRPFTLRVELHNRDRETLTVDRIDFSVDGQILATVSESKTIPGNASATYTAELALDAAGLTKIRVDISGAVGTKSMTAGKELELTFLTEDLVTTILADDSHGTCGDLDSLAALAAKHRMQLVRTGSLTAQQLGTCDVLLIPAPERAFEEAYLALIRDYVRTGRTLILCGSGDAGNPDSAVRLNTLAEALGLTARFRDDLAYDPANNSGNPDQLRIPFPTSETPFAANGSCTLVPGSGASLVTASDTAFSIDGDGDGAGNSGGTYTETVDGIDVIRNLVALPGEAVLLVRENTSFGGRVYLSGGMFPADGLLNPGGNNPWEKPNGNTRILEEILNISREELPVTPIAQAKTAQVGETVRIRGHVTAGTAVPGNRFPGMIYLQDETGGLGIPEFTTPGIGVGTAMECYLQQTEDGLWLLHWELSGGEFYNYLPANPGIGELLKEGTCPEQLVKAEGRIVSRVLREDGAGVSAFILEDHDGNRITVMVEDSIKSASTGKNTLAEFVREENWVSAAGILYVRDSQRMIRVRNCDEVVLVRETDRNYEVLKGAYSVWIRKNGKSLYMEVEGPGEEFLGIEVDGKMIDQSHYQTTEHDHLYFRFWPRYLKTLETGSHDVVFKFRSGQANATIVVWNHADNPYTGDPIMLYCAAMVLSGTALLSRRNRRKRN